jgi:hypothetical protein
MLLDSSAVALHKGGRTSRIWFDGRLDVAMKPEIKTLTKSWILGIFVWPVKTILSPFWDHIHSLRIRGTLADPVVSNTLFPDLFESGTDRPRSIAPDPWWEPRPPAPVEF